MKKRAAVFFIALLSVSLSFAKENMGIQSVSLQRYVVGLALLFCLGTGSEDDDSCFQYRLG